MKKRRMCETPGCEYAAHWKVTGEKYPKEFCANCGNVHEDYSKPPVPVVTYFCIQCYDRNNLVGLEDYL